MTLTTPTTRLLLVLAQFGTDQALGGQDSSGTGGSGGGARSEREFSGLDGRLGRRQWLGAGSR